MHYPDFGMDTASLAGSLEAKLAAIAGAGFTQVMISAPDLVGHPSGTEAGIAALRASGLRVTGCEALRDFEGLDGRLHAYKVDVAKAMLTLTRDVGARLLLVEASTSPHATTDADLAAADLAKLALLAVPLGIRVALKATPGSRTAPTLPAAADLVDRAACSNLGLVVDAFDVLASATGDEDVEDLDPARVFLVQLSDALWNVQRSEEEQRVARAHFRVFPGEGAHSDALADLVRRLDRLGYYGDYSFDVYNDDFLQLPPRVVAARAQRAAVWLGETVLRRALPVPDVERLREASTSEVATARPPR